MHALTITDSSGSFRRDDTLLFRTAEGARGYAARRGDFYGVLTFKLDGFPLRPRAEEAGHVEEPIGYRAGDVDHLYEGEAA